MKNIFVNLWYSYLSRRLWETPKGSYGIIPHYEYNYTLFSYMIAFACIGAVKHFLLAIKGYTFDELINKGTLFFFQETWFIFISFLLVIYYFVTLNEFILTGTTVKRWHIKQYAKIKTEKEAIKRQSNKDLLSEYTRKERMLLWATVTVWAPLALIDGGLRPARLLVQAPYNNGLVLLIRYVCT